MSGLIAFLAANWLQLLAALHALLLALVAFFLLIPGDQPEKAIKGVADFLEKFSVK